MPGNPYISAKYRRLPAYPQLPKPALGKDVGLSCPLCPQSQNKSLVYSSSGIDTVNVKCPTVKHYVRTFKVNQLLHEISLINAGVKIPIPFDSAAHGGPVNIDGTPVVPRVTRPKTEKVGSHKVKRQPPSLLCQRIKEGPIAVKHKSKGHTGCVNKFCKSCCVEFVEPGLCYVHRPDPTPDPKHSSPTSDRTSEAPVPPKRPRLLPAQCSQSVRRVGRLLSEDGQLILQSARKNIEEAARKYTNPLIDVGKVVSLHLVTHGPKLPVISHVFKAWPVAILSECPSLMREAQTAAGPDWDDQLLIWDEDIKNWREIGVNIPHGYPPNSRNIVICLPKQRASLSNDLQDILEGFGLGKPQVPKITLASEAKPVTPTQVTIIIDDSDLDDDIQGPPLPPSTSSEVNDPIPIPSTPDFHRPFDPLLFGQGSNDHSLVDTKPALPNLNSDHKPNDSGPPLKSWPGIDLLLSDLLDWYCSAGEPAERTHRIKLWIQRYGTVYRLVDKTVYRYAAFVHEVGYNRMRQWLNDSSDVETLNKEKITVAKTRRQFQKEWNTVCSLDASTADDQLIDEQGKGLAVQSVHYHQFLPHTAHFVTLLHTNSFERCNPAPSPVACFSASENLGWKALPFDPLPDDDSETDWVFGLLQPNNIPEAPQDLLQQKWSSTPVDIDVDQNTCLASWDGRRTYPAVWHRRYGDVKLDACALDGRNASIHHHLRFAQVYAHAACLLKKFKLVINARVLLSEEDNHLFCKLHIVENLVMRKRFEPNSQGIRWFHLREKCPGPPEYITSDLDFGPRHHADSFLGRLFECFTHWSYNYHGCQALLCGFRGYDSVITDLAIMDNTRPWYLQNTYTGGLQGFASTHICNIYCDSIGLKAPLPYYPVGPPPVNPFEG
ncbi:hypothetical protein DFH28DRAFT_1077512 [Melampsora americana]|nr:hypothetical protein DFH28DRAFT_1077512 [Melampsora americana]